MAENNQEIINPLVKERPSSYADKLGRLYISTISKNSKKEKGQFFTPIEIADFMGKQIYVNKSSISILDPGCGIGMLSCSLIENITKDNAIRNIKLIVYEIDISVLPYTKLVLDYLRETLKKNGTELSYTINNEDFVLSNYQALDLQPRMMQDELEKFDIIISNPPYFKLSKEDIRVKVSQSIINGQPNIYSLFMAISSCLLNDDGQLIFIVPRSFTSGRYFRLFRNFFLNNIQVSFIHLFNTRKDTFSKDNVLQETLILKGKKKTFSNIDNSIIISSSQGINDLDIPKQKSYPLKDLIDTDSVEKIIHLPVNTEEEEIIKLFKTWTGSLNKYDIQISTGPVVAFRSEEFLLENPETDNAPLFWLHNVIKMLVDHPVYRKDKKQYMIISHESRAILLPNKNYVFLRRFSSKDDKSRLIAAPYFCSTSKANFIGVENKLNYIYRPKGHLERFETMGISALLDSDLFDTYFRTFNGNVNVSATELREMPMPPLEIIKEIGKQLILKNDFSIENVNEIVNSFFKI
ncbi:adenine-specific DNA-methyltransferase [Dysgonomonas sp. PFB1-18]|uniref:Eco57I restriction-modification methylase domain-containing protein n=1 Tax=unclassified Dysgonomonas TaxID=2630389 RepID=UPI002473D7DD|nr:MULTISPECIES: Eco57I restriction-modification methylase domain-containing protein [unclassified Dysgonomonas]MDH6309081.1 adenine-specific DNA-methyltransferase [Dysgonomonas sp. PF1-14]MDH6338832.1 adenine-specific DNA-methyltransferase [Dysgonomonas sp. PF1-16]MDH6380140.1 adenine-specific DNA-methyltransferase [Dysgonomonas sp. PFB1-18]MDH6397470.1 adenine-specific DNA-methyltransferase [Dysgonomonas sp. PF1-23]